MTGGAVLTMPERRVARIQEKGQVTLPVDLRRKLGLKKGDLVSFVETNGGVLIAPQAVGDTKAPKTLAEQGISLEELLLPEPTEGGISLREYSDEQIAQFIRDDRLSDEARAVLERFGRKRAR